ncbi:substrate-binding domain-containing protein [Phaeovulum sp.]|uniref:substrate-binding domain-containing protein n=1 Tax=Phaeovulum sp. TaxID=2934796 RepID=UPI002731F28C|nr:substrate-binding domain-containing protein [Phaeovulum sp.]MDP1668005.1 substrate-binding domain-containing protein [Phaeovulum sp.]MDP2061677.1 substrate-binding domain-containing protein [Phaeovulum sp.]MDP3860553.1 substrate-binding domain-containing protein [Phaeovulum sp.]MDZ4119454.1 substrate-binding domain-containing protein [Phaeovulum sp.]
MKKLLGTLAGAALALGLAVSAQAQTRPTMGVVVKIGGIPWFNAMEMGILERAAELGIDAFMVGPTSADPALQVRAIEDLIAKGVDVIGVVPNDEAALEPVLAKARAAGIKVIAHEGPGLTNVDWDFELASVQGFGEAHAELLAQKMGGKGEYAMFVGSLTVPLHNAWADAANAYIAAKYPEMKLIGERYGVAESVDDSRKTALDLMAANPNLRGFLAFGSQGPIGAGRAIEERRMTGQVFVLGPFSPGQGRKLVKDGVISGGFMWNPAEAGRVFVTMGKLLIDGTAITDGMEIPGLGVVHPDVANLDIITDNLLNINADTVDALADLGL